MQRDAFADAAAPQDADSLARIHGEADIVQHPVAAEGFADVLKFDVRLVMVAHRRFRARAKSPGVFRLSNIRGSKARRTSSASSIRRTVVWQNSGSILFLPARKADS